MQKALELDDLRVHYPTGGGLLKAVDGVSLSVGTGETVGLVGESGCGKSTLARCVVGLNAPTGGAVRLAGWETSGGRGDRLTRARVVQMIFQDPMGSLNPRLTTRQTIELPLKVHGIGNRAERLEKVLELMKQVGLGPHLLDRYPHELSGGQRQRVSIARALALEPALLICDEIVSALDVSVQAQVLNLLTDLQTRLGIAFLFITHDLAVVRYLSDRIVVMYLGRIVEEGPAESVWNHARHPYTQALVSSIPDRMAGTRLRLSGDLPSPIDPPSGCGFRTRCPHARPICAEQRPELRGAGLPHLVACHFAAEIPELAAPAPAATAP
ncbi:ABC transporter ATP-binding protein [Ruixingdingia sedimenti]|uniref:ATP-binding cassette domain-containing protein n=1 Tax=Ruixingdingia sedimenti TaxID=3073604 RepID=A0ABU1F6S8_9RHOB|nr:oligopeptide/dipeptide ABC transporter ATP-binding protein [Xinfangfangia sp. LG-4]MDR5652566.1 ATP-binding cassette domain-containing protein [Xinfangfangia sp. LG-4]